MSQADNLLNTLATSQFSAEEHIVIGTDRFITVPKELQRIAVQHDHNVETVTFDCPRYWDDNDLSTMIVYIMYMLPNGDTGCYPADNVIAYDTSMSFDWTISRNITAVKGKLSFLVCIKKTDSEGNEEIHWNSEINTDMYISEGMECTEVALSDYPDLVTQLLLRMKTVEDDLAAGVTAQQEYDATSILPQSGKAVAQAIDALDVDNKLDNKLDKSTFKYGMYGVDANGNQTMYKQNSEATPYSIPLRNANGALVTKTPVSDNEAATKAYVDNAVSESSGWTTIATIEPTTPIAANPYTISGVDFENIKSLRMQAYICTPEGGTMFKHGSLALHIGGNNLSVNPVTFNNMPKYIALGKAYNGSFQWVYSGDENEYGNIYCTYDGDENYQIGVSDYSGGIPSDINSPIIGESNFMSVAFANTWFIDTVRTNVTHSITVDAIFSKSGWNQKVTEGGTLPPNGSSENFTTFVEYESGDIIEVPWDMTQEEFKAAFSMKDDISYREYEVSDINEIVLTEGELICWDLLLGATDDSGNLIAHGEVLVYKTNSSRMQQYAGIHSRDTNNNGHLSCTFNHTGTKTYTVTTNDYTSSEYTSSGAILSQVVTSDYDQLPVGALYNAMPEEFISYYSWSLGKKRTFAGSAVCFAQIDFYGSNYIITNKLRSGIQYGTDFDEWLMYDDTDKQYGGALPDDSCDKIMLEITDDDGYGFYPGSKIKIEALY